MKRDFNKWLASLGPAAPVKTLGELIAWNKAHEKAGAIKYGQSNLDVSDEMDLEKDRARYEADRAKDIKLGGTHGIDEVMKSQRLDAILFPGASGAAIAAKPGYPTVIVPFALVPNRTDAAVPGGIRREAGSDGRELHRHGVQRAEAARARVRVRAGDQETRPAAVYTMTEAPTCPRLSTRRSPMASRRRFIVALPMKIKGGRARRCGRWRSFREVRLKPDLGNHSKFLLPNSERWIDCEPRDRADRVHRCGDVKGKRPRVPAVPPRSRRRGVRPARRGSRACS